MQREVYFSGGGLALHAPASAFHLSIPYKVDVNTNSDGTRLARVKVMRKGLS